MGLVRLLRRVKWQREGLMGAGRWRRRRGKLPKLPTTGGPADTTPARSCRFGPLQRLDLRPFIYPPRRSIESNKGESRPPCHRLHYPSNPSAPFLSASGMAGRRMQHHHHHHHRPSQHSLSSRPVDMHVFRTRLGQTLALPDVPSLDSSPTQAIWRVFSTTISRLRLHTGCPHSDSAQLFPFRQGCFDSADPSFDL